MSDGPASSVAPVVAHRHPAGEMLAVATEFMEQEAHPSVVIGGYVRALDDMLKILEGVR
jgi:chaperonin GroEL (HSP60 family)